MRAEAARNALVGRTYSARKGTYTPGAARASMAFGDTLCSAGRASIAFVIQIPLARILYPGTLRGIAAGNGTSKTLDSFTNHLHSKHKQQKK